MPALEGIMEALRKREGEGHSYKPAIRSRLGAIVKPAFAQQQRGKFMGMTTIDATVFNPTDPSRRAEVQFMVDSGAGYSVVSATLLQELGIQPHTKKHFYLANGDRIERQMGNAGFEYKGEIAHAPVLFGEEGDAALMGVTTLEGFGFVLDPLRRELRPMSMRM